MNIKDLINDMIDRQEYFEFVPRHSINYPDFVTLHVDCANDITNYIEYLSYYKKYEEWFDVGVDNTPDDGLTLVFTEKIENGKD